MIKSGITSVTFRKLSPLEIAEHSKAANLAAIEWGGDIHVPHGDVKTAKEVRRITEGEGLLAPSYGSYYRVAELDKSPDFGDVVKSAVALGADTIRVWAGAKGSKDADDRYFSDVVKDTARIANIAGSEGINIAFEYHGGTLTDTKESAVKLLDAIDMDNVFTYWQPPNDKSERERISSLNAVLNRVSNVHVFNWPQGTERHPLEEGISKWESYFNILKNIKGDRYAFLEFIKDDSIEQFLKDAKCLNKMLKEVNS